MRKIFLGCLLALPILATPLAQAQAPFPNKPIRWLVPYPAGGGADFVARTIGQTLSQQTSQPVLIENKPGGNTAIAAAELVRSTADGHHIMLADNGTLIFNSALYKTLSYNPAKDLAPVTLMGRLPMILVVTPSHPAKDAREFIAQAKAASNGTPYASAGAGSPHHLAMELLKTEAGLKLTHVPYKGAAPALTDVAGGQVPAMMVDMAAGAGFIKGGKVRPLAVAHATRLAQLPDVPTFTELGFKQVEAAALVGLVAPSGTPAATVEALNKRVVAAIQEPATQQKLVDFGVQPVGNTQAEYAALLQAEISRWHKLIKDLNITLD